MSLSDLSSGRADERRCSKRWSRTQKLIKPVILLAMHSKVFNLVQRNGLVFRGIIIWWLVAFGVSPEGAKIDFPCRDGPYWIDHNCHKWILENQR